MVALLIGAFFGLALWAGVDPNRSDFGQIWYGARALIDGVSPYHVVGPSRAFERNWPLLYPLPAIVVASPLALMSLRNGMALFGSISCAALALVPTRDSWGRLPLIASAPLVFAMGLVQWSPLLTAVALIPPLGFLLVVKPTIGASLGCTAPLSEP